MDVRTAARRKASEALMNIKDHLRKAGNYLGELQRANREQPLDKACVQRTEDLAQECADLRTLLLGVAEGEDE